MTGARSKLNISTAARAARTSCISLLPDLHLNFGGGNNRYYHAAGAAENNVGFLWSCPPVPLSVLFLRPASSKPRSLQE